MFYNYSKITTAFAAFALLFSTGAWSQCAEGEIAVDYSIGGGSYTTEISWILNGPDGTTIFSDGPGIPGGASGTECLTPGEYTFIGTDSYGDGWNGNYATFSINGNVIASFTILLEDCAAPDCSGSIVFTVSADVSGCMDATASNYNVDATVDDGSCCYNDVVTITLLDSWGDGANLGAQGGLQFQGEFYPFTAGDELSVDFCLTPGCYNGVILTDFYGDETSWEVYLNGVEIASGGGVSQGSYQDIDVFFYTDDGSCVLPGCTDDLACNYDAPANVNDGSCEYLTCAGCLDPTACNYDPTATFNDSSCDFSCIGCMDATAINYDADATLMCEDCCSYCEGVFAGTLTVDGGTYQSEVGWSLSLDGETVAAGGAPYSGSLCLEAGCYVFIMTDSWGDGWNGNTYSFDGYDGVNVFSGDINTAAVTDLSVGADYLDFNGGSCTFGCNDAGACNYDETVAYDDGSCDYDCVGCTDSTAANYDPNATIDSGLCVYCLENVEFVLTLNMTDSFGDGWNGAEYYVYNQTTGDLELTGSLDTAFSGDGLTEGADLICLAPGCYTVEVSSGSSPSEISISMTDQLGTFYGSTGGGSVYPLDFLLSGACGFEGCTSPTALNYNPSATIDDESCEEPPLNDQLANAEALACEAYVSGTLLYATDSEDLVGTEFAGNEVTSNGVWYVLNAASDQQVTISTCDTPTNTDDSTDYTGDTKLHVYTQAVDGSLVAMASNDDGCDAGFLSNAIFNVSTGVDYFIYVTEYLPTTPGNDFVLTVTCTECEGVPSNDDCNDATALINGETFTGSTCCANQESLAIPAQGFGTAYGVWFTFNSQNFDTFDFNLTNLTNEGVGLGFMGSGDCESLIGVAGCYVAETCAGSVEAFLNLEPNTDYYACVFTNDPNTCGDFEFSTYGVSFGCTDAAATNYDADATTDDGTCEYTDVVPANDLCDNAEALVCNTLTTGSTGGASILGSPIGVVGCQTAPGAGVWYSFEGDGQFHTLSTCGSDIDSKINLYTADVACGGGGVDVPPADACGEGLVTVNYQVGGGLWDGEISWELADAAGSVVAFGGSAGDPLNDTPLNGSSCLVEGDYTLTMNDSYGDGWNGGTATFTNGIGEVIGFFGLEAGETGTETFSVAAYSMEPTYQPGDFTCVAASSSSDGTGVCTLFDDDDVSIEFVSTVGALYYVLVGSETTPGAFDLTFDCTPVVEGCTNSAACNFDSSANVSTETCDYESCVCTTETGTPVQLNMEDDYGDGWNDAAYTISDLAGNLIFEGSLDDAQFSVSEDNFPGPESGFDLLCLEPGCYNISVAGGFYENEVSWDLSLLDGTILVSGGAPDSQTISVGGAVCGCTDEGACNYDALATDDDGTCEDESCAGCTDSQSCSYDGEATISDPSACCYENCVEVQMFDSYGDGWVGQYTLSTIDGTEVATGTLASGTNATDVYCLPDGCYVIDVVCNETTWCVEMSWTVLGAFGGLVSGGPDQSMMFNVGSGDQCVPGCTISCACNYNDAANIQDLDQCVFSGCSGCTYPDASNYDETSISDDGSCTFLIANPCPADLNGDGTVTATDLLLFLGAFGSTC